MYSKILVPLDGSDLAEAVLPYVAELAKKFGSRVVLLQVVEPLEKVIAETMPATIEPTAGAATVGIEIAEEQVEAEHELAERYLSAEMSKLQAEGLNVSSAIVEGNVADEIIRYANENGIDLIAMSTHGRGGLGRLVFGSVSDAVLRSAACPLLLIRSQEHHRKER